MTIHNPIGFSFSPRQHHDPTVGDKIMLAVSLEVVTDFSAGGNDVAFVNDGAANSAAPPDFHPVHDHGVFNLAITVNSNVTAHYAVPDHAAADNRSLSDDGVHSRALAIGPFKNEFGRRIAKFWRSERPAPIVQIKRRIHRTEIHVCFVVGFDGSEITPVTRLLALLGRWDAVFAEVVSVHVLVLDQGGQDVFAEVMLARILPGVA